MKKIKFLLIFSFLFLIIFETILNFHEEIQNLREYKKTHCLEKQYIFLCPNVNQSFKREDNQFWKLSTNKYGERITPKTIRNKGKEEIWFIGDSISFGYLVSDKDSLPYLLDKEIQIPVRNLGIDSLGTNGILYRLKNALEIHSNVNVETLIWIYNTSDFLDDIREKEINSSKIKSLFYKLHFYLSKYSNSYNFLLYFRKKVKQKREIPDIENITPEIDNHSHITFLNIKNLINFVKNHKRIKRFIVIIYPGMNIKTLQADRDHKVTQSVYKFFKKNSIEVLDVRNHFLNGNFYFTFDGHPNENGYRIILSPLIDLLKQK